MFYVSNIRKIGILKNIHLRFVENQFYAWVAICKYKAFQGMVKSMFLFPCGKHVFQKACITYVKKYTLNV